MGTSRRSMGTMVSLTAAVALLIAAAAVMMQGDRADAEQGGAQAGPLADIDRAVAVIHPTEGNDAAGVLSAEQVGDEVRLIGRIEGLDPDSRHGFHIHEFGDCTAEDATSAGGHYNPEDHPHGLPNAGDRHAGDLGNLEANDQGVAVLELTVDNLTVAGDHNPILGRGVIVHASEDDGSQPLGDAGPRIGCGVLGVAQPPEE